MSLVHLSLRVRQQYPDQAPDNIRQTMDGDMEKTDSGWMLAYQEPGEGMEGVRTKIHMEPGKVTLFRTGSISSVMTFVAGEQTAFSYGIDVGTMEMEIFTEQLHWAFTGKTGSLDMRYRILVPGGDTGIIDYHLQMK